MVSASRAKRDIWTFLALLLLFSSMFYAPVILLADAPKQWGSYVLLFMWCPGLAALVTKLVRDRSLRGLGWGWGRARYFLIAYGLALTVCLLPYLFVWFAFDAFSRSQFIDVLSKAGLPSALRGPGGLLVVVLVLSPLTGLISATGEEIGWRGFLVYTASALYGAGGVPGAPTPDPAVSASAPALSAGAPAIDGHDAGSDASAVPARPAQP